MLYSVPFSLHAGRRGMRSGAGSHGFQNKIREKCWLCSAIVSAPATALPPGQSYPDDLQRRLDAQGYAWRVVNLGISGDTTTGGVARLNTATRAEARAWCCWNSAATTACAACRWP